jgi:hypothetical protein
VNLGKPSSRWKENIKINPQYLKWEGMGSFGFHGMRGIS